jgi:hypothetical protein
VSALKTDFTMNFLKTCLLALLAVPANLSFLLSQTADTTFFSYEDVGAIQQSRDSFSHLVYADTANGYRIAVPSWCMLHESHNPCLFIGTLPAVHGIENCISIQGFPKDNFTSESFEFFVVTGNVMREHTMWSKEHMLLNEQELERDTVSGRVSYFVQVFWAFNLYNCQYVLIETPKAFLWVNFVATKETYAENLGKFEAFLAGLAVGD